MFHFKEKRPAVIAFMSMWIYLQCRRKLQKKYSKQAGLNLFKGNTAICFASGNDFIDLAWYPPTPTPQHNPSISKHTPHHVPLYTPLSLQTPPALTLHPPCSTIHPPLSSCRPPALTYTPMPAHTPLHIHLYTSPCPPTHTSCPHIHPSCPHMPPMTSFSFLDSTRFREVQ